MRCGNYGLTQVLSAVFRQHYDAPARSHSFETQIIRIACIIYIFSTYLYTAIPPKEVCIAFMIIQLLKIVEIILPRFICIIRSN